MIKQLAKTFNRLYPLWLLRPNCIQIDTQNMCNLQCIYCNVREGYGFHLPRGRMTDAMLETIIKYWGKYHVWAIAPFMNGEPMLETRLPQINQWVQDYTNAICIIDTNGTISQNQPMLLHRNMKIVRFTISAATQETYLKVHGANRFLDAVNTLTWFRRYKFPTQQVMIHFITNKFNEHEQSAFIDMFRGFLLRIYSLHEHPQQTSSQNAKGLGSYHIPLIISESGKRHYEILPNAPCQCWDSFAIGFHGELMQCSDYPYQYNYGNVKDTDMMTAWKERLKNKMDNPLCKDCNVKYPNWKHIIDKYVK